jgi:uncharacterized protein YcfL
MTQQLEKNYRIHAGVQWQCHSLSVFFPRTSVLTTQPLPFGHPRRILHQYVFIIFAFDACRECPGADTMEQQKVMFDLLAYANVLMFPPSLMFYRAQVSSLRSHSTFPTKILCAYFSWYDGAGQLQVRWTSQRPPPPLLF